MTQQMRSRDDRPQTAGPADLDVSIILPAYNEEASIEAAVAEVFEHVLPVIGDGELVVVDDGSTDRTGALLDAMAATRPRLRVVHQPTAGPGPALIRAGTVPR